MPKAPDPYDIEIVNAPPAELSDLYHRMLTAPWWVDRQALSIAYAQTGPSEWARVKASDLARAQPRVVTPAQVLMIVVPKDAQVTAEVTIDNKDIGFVNAGQRAAIQASKIGRKTHKFQEGLGEASTHTFKTLPTWSFSPTNITRTTGPRSPLQYATSVSGHLSKSIAAPRASGTTCQRWQGSSRSDTSRGISSRPRSRLLSHS